MARGTYSKEHDCGGAGAGGCMWLAGLRTGELQLRSLGAGYYWGVESMVAVAGGAVVRGRATKE